MLPGEYTFVPVLEGPLNAPYSPSVQVRKLLRPVPSRTRIGGYPGVSPRRVAAESLPNCVALPRGGARSRGSGSGRRRAGGLVDHSALTSETFQVPWTFFTVIRTRFSSTRVPW